MRMTYSPAQRRFLRNIHLYNAMIIFLRFFIFFAFLLLWQICSDNGYINSFIFSSPSRLVETFKELCTDGQILGHIGITMYETLIAFAIITILGLIIAIILWYFKWLSDCLEPALVILNSLPKSALAPMLIVWLGANMKAIITTAVSVAIFGMIINLYTGFMSLDSEKITLIKVLGGKKHHVLTKLIIPGSIKVILSNMKVNIGLCLVGVIIGEFLAAKKGLGYLIIYGSQVFKMSYVILGIVILCIISTILFLVVDVFQKMFLKDL